MSAGTVKGQERRNKAEIKIAAIFIYLLSKLVRTWAVTECTRELGGGGVQGGVVLLCTCTLITPPPPSGPLGF